MRNKVLIFSLIINIIIIGLALPVFAQSNINQNTEAESIQISSIDDILTIISNITSWMYRILLAIVVIFVLMAAFTFLTSSDNTDNIKKARKQILYAAIAVVIAILSFSVSTIITNVLSG
jgi:heme O synthase-like polyprenyltransferase